MTQHIKLRLKKSVRFVLDIFSLIYGLIYYFLNKTKPIGLRTPPHSHQSLIRLFCATSGRSNDFLSKCISFFDKPIKLPDNNGILGNFSDKEVEQLVQRLEQDGYYIFNQKLSEDLINNLYEFSLKAPCVPRRLDNEDPNSVQVKTTYDKNNPKAAIYDIQMEHAIENPYVQRFLRDHSILAIVQKYLKTSPKIDFMALWWSTAFCKTPQLNCAQLFHFDMDRIKWLKLFIFLTDVTLENGPHVFVRRSHLTGQIPQSLLQGGYIRHRDEVVLKHYPKEDVKVFTVPAGTILLEDTRGMHKGTPLIKNHRLVLELQFSNSLFGALTPGVEKLQIGDQKLFDFAEKNKKIFKLYTLCTLKLGKQ